MSLQESRVFNVIAGTLSAKERKALMEAMWARSNEASMQAIPVQPDREPRDDEQLFYVGFLGAKRDGIPTQHYMVAAPDEWTAVIRAHQLYELQPRRRKGSKLRVLLGKPPSMRSSP